MPLLITMILVLLAGCSGPSGSPAGNTSSTMPHMEEVDTLRKTKPQITFVVAKPKGESGVLEVVVADVKNLAKQAVIVDVFTATGPTEEKLGAFTLYPADHPGNFIFKVSTSTRAKDGNLKIVLKLKSASQFEDTFFLVVKHPSWIRD